MIGLRSSNYWTVVAAIYVLNLMMSDSCSIFKSRKYVTIDTNICVFQNFTEPVSEWACVKTCYKNATVSNTKKVILAKLNEALFLWQHFTSKRRMWHISEWVCDNLVKYK